MSQLAEVHRVDATAPVQAPVPGRPVFRSLGGSPARKYFLHVPRTATRSSPIVVVVHGISRNAAEHLFRFMPEAERCGAILVAPLFLREAYGQYQQVLDPERRVRADLALIDIVADVARLTGNAAERVHLFGFSGGAQFAHRFTLMHPHRVASLVCCAAGWYTFPDPELPFPFGLGTHPVAGGRFDLSAFLEVPVHVLVGGRDVARDGSVRASAALDDQQGPTRLERARRWFGSLTEAAARAGNARPARSFHLMPGAGHSFSDATARHGLTRIAFEKFCLGPAPRLRKAQW